ncbi:MAG: SlyX family protein [Chiayiivirga sp.]|jgi:SlyX protein|uniref:SlyX family protein n=1 Tax=Chiayiivirga sp. TaxID=2041042 RepID=UPI0025C37870|nr:SlyX family protein [Chiayiivirga sp.]MCI1709576.1 SlyX family protein [Chiayiivirga sp.]MCI1730136.1 SlyX family protein [Chiayiivirga sp.]
MSENERLVELETRVAFQEHTLAELNEVMTAQGRELIELRRELERALADLKTLRGLLYADPASEPPPPHY